MAERVVSPGVFTRERDLSFLEQGVANIGAAFVGVAQKGPAFVPVVVDSQTEFENRFGKADEYSYLGYTVQNYLQEAQSATVVRVLGLGGYKAANAKSVVLPQRSDRLVRSEFTLMVKAYLLPETTVDKHGNPIDTNIVRFTNKKLVITERIDLGGTEIG